MDSTIVVAVIGGLGAIGSAYLSYRASTSANRAAAEATKIKAVEAESEAYVRSQHFYEKLLEEADAHLDRLRTQVRLLGEELDRVTQQLSQEQHISDGLRTQIRALQNRIIDVESAMARLRRQFIVLGGGPAESDALNP